MRKACFNCWEQQARDRAPVFFALIGNKTKRTLTHGRSTRPRGADCGSSARRRSGALLLWAIASLLVACGGASHGTTAGPTRFGSVTLAWDAVSAPDVGGYTLYYGTDHGLYSQSVNVGHVNTYTLTGLIIGATYYFAATTYDTSNYEGPYSDEISATIPDSDTSGRR